jgi:hypothetical protein
VESAFPQGRRPIETRRGSAAGPPAAHLAKSSAPANIVIIADTDLLMDYMWVQTREMFGSARRAGLRQQRRLRGQYPRQLERQQRAHQHPRPRQLLASIRARGSAAAPSRRPAARKAMELQSELQQTESKLTDLQSKRNDQASLMLTPEQEEELKHFTAEKARVRKELRETSAAWTWTSTGSTTRSRSSTLWWRR